MFWLIGIYYIALLGFLIFTFPAYYDDPVVLGIIVFFSIFIFLIPPVVFSRQKKKYKKDVELIQKNADQDIETVKQSHIKQIRQIEFKTEQKIDNINVELERLSSINVLEIDKLLLNVDNHLKKLVPAMNGETYETYVGYKIAYSGWSDITYTPVTGDYGADIIATDKNGDKVCIQCKRYDHPVGIEAVQEVIAAKQYYGAKRAVVATNSVMTAQARNMAQRTDVELWEHFV